MDAACAKSLSSSPIARLAATPTTTMIVLTSAKSISVHTAIHLISISLVLHAAGVQKTISSGIASFSSASTVTKDLSSPHAATALLITTILAKSPLSP